jgi:HEAT repeat protein
MEYGGGLNGRLRLASALSDPDPSARRRSMRALAESLPVPGHFTARVIASLSDRDPFVRLHAVRFLERADATSGSLQPAVRLALQRALRDRDHHVRARALHAFGVLPAMQDPETYQRELDSGI